MDKKKLDDLVYRKLVPGAMALGMIIGGIQWVHGKHVQKNLDPSAITKEDIPEKWNHQVNWRDIDGDGDYESYLFIGSGNTRYELTPITKVEGKIVLPGVDDKAVLPGDYPTMEGTDHKMLPLDYADVDGDGKLESLFHLKVGEEVVNCYVVEKHGGQYKFTELEME